MESPVIFTTYPLNTGSFSCRKYALPMLFVTTAMKPLSDFTTPRRLMALISRHFLPVEQPDPCCCTTGLKNGSRFPFIAHFLSSALGLAGSAGFASAATALAGAAPFASCLAATALGAAALATAVFASATFVAGAAFVVVATATAAFGAGAAFAAATGADFAGAVAALFATGAAALDPSSVCRISTNFPAGPDDTS